MVDPASGTLESTPASIVVFEMQVPPVVPHVAPTQSLPSKHLVLPAPLSPPNIAHDIHARSPPFPLPSQVPFATIVEPMQRELHSASGSPPAATGSHLPSMPEPFLAVVHASQAPVHPVSQQTPSD